MSSQAARRTLLGLQEQPKPSATPGTSRSLPVMNIPAHEHTRTHTVSTVPTSALVVSITIHNVPLCPRRVNDLTNMGAHMQA